ncbi:MAG: hypothetical protein SVY10_04280 [Thermodesulfobacteriota bacterium]|nr:hypothetical protein [Thermodesulfobacteriota bacterium]
MEENKMKKLSVLLDHWVKHNDDHVKEYRKWAEIADKEGLSQVEKNLRDAADLILQSSEKFHAAKRSMPVIWVQGDHEHHHEHNHHKHDSTEE